MTRRIQITLLSLLMSVCAMASETSVKNSDGVDIWYIFNSSTKTASVTYRGNYNTSYSNEYTGNVVIPSTVTYEGEKYSVTSIGDYAFCGCDALTSITLPEGVTSIGKYAFNSRYSLTSITLPEGVTSIGDDAFYCCYKLYEVYNKSDLTITAGSRDNGDVARYAKNVYTDSEGESKLKTVGDYLFYADGEDIELIAYTGSETSITLPSDYEGKNYNIGDYAFYSCDALTSITLPEGVTSIGDYAFYSCDALTSITLPEGLTSIGEWTFYSCDALTSITLPEGLTSIGDYAFAYCYSLTSITLPESLTEIGVWTFGYCDALTSITLPEGLTSIGNSAFDYCTALTSITLPESLTSIGYEAFRYCYKLYEVYNKSDLTITAGSTDNGYVARYAKNVYTDSEGESKLKTVGDYIFYVEGEDIELIAYTGSETSITLPSDYEGKNYNIVDYAFRCCSSLTSITLPEGLTSIGERTFSGCSALTSITLPEGVTSIGESAFNGCNSLTSITLPEGVTSIRKHAFRACSALTSITLPEGLTSIGSWTFEECSALTSITIPESVTSIGDYAFTDCSALTELNYNGTIADWCGISFGNHSANPLYYVGHLYIDGEEVKDLVIPSGVTAIKDYAFYNCDGLTSITIPEGVTSIGESAFNGCNSLTSITLPESLTSIGEWTFSGCSALTSITLPKGLTSIRYAAFHNCYRLYEVYNKSNLTITAGNSDNGDVARYAKNVYTDSEGESKLKTVGDYIFYADGEDIELIAYTGSETSITLPSDYEGKNYNIGNYAFRGCNSLTSITLPKGVESIGDFAFYECDALRSITLPEGLTSIGNSAFCYCSALKSITSKNATPPTIGGSYTFKNVNKSIPVYVPKSSVDAYKSAVYWKDFTNFIGGDYFVDVTAENGTVEGAGAYEENAEATLTITPAEGYKFVQWSDGVKDNPRTIVVVSDMTLTADIQKSWTIYATAENGDISGVGVYFEGDEATLTATPAEGYKFVQWSDGVTDNPRTIVVVSDMTFTAEFELKEYTLTTEAENGTVEGAGTYKHGDEATLTATPAEGYEFVQWSDGVTDNSRTIVVVSDMTFTAEFELKEYTLTTEAENGTVEGAGTYKHGDEATLTATPAEGYKFVQWSDGVTDNPRTIVVVSDMTFTAEFELKEYTLTTEAENGTVEGAGTYKHGDEATVTATPAEGYKFVQWSDGVTDNPRTIEVTSDLILTAEFEIDVTPISDIQTSDVNVRLIGNEIAVEGTDDYAVYSISGQNLGKAESVERGIYIVVANGKCCKVIAK